MIVPTRSTSYTHLRDAFMRALQIRLVSGIRDGTLTEEVAQEVASPMRKLKSIFPNAPLAKHAPLDIFLSVPNSSGPRTLVFRDIGSIENDWVATEFVLHYFEGDGPSPPVSLFKSTCQVIFTFTCHLVEEGCHRTCQNHWKVIFILRSTIFGPFFIFRSTFSAPESSEMNWPHVVQLFEMSMLL